MAEHLAASAEIRHVEHGPGDSMAALATHLLATAPARFSLAAHGMGGFIAFEAWRRAPDRIQRLALLDTSASQDAPAQTERRRRYAELVEQGRFAQLMDERLPLLLHPARQQDSELLATARRMAMDIGPARFLTQQQAIITRPDSCATLRTITCPTLILFGREDRIVTLDDATRIHDGICGSRLEIIEDCGHLVMLERPDAVSRALRHWLSA